MKKPKSDIVPGKTQSPLVGDVNYPAGEAPPVRSSDFNTQNTPSPAPEGGKYVGDAASAEHPSGTAPKQHTNG